MPLPDRPEWLEQILAWNLEVWGERIPGYDEQGWRDFYGRAMVARYDRYQPGAELVWGIESEHRLIGSIALVGEDDLPDHLDKSPWMAAFVIDPALRHQGFGRDVVRVFESWCLEHDVSTLYLWTDTYADWYRSLGYSQIGVTQLAHISAVVMSKEL